MNASDSRAHFQDAHYIEEPRSNCVSRKRKSGDDEENMQDANVSKKAKNEEEKAEGRNAEPTSYVIR
ncbi:hypothetical protein V500_01495 [Pseudogymnoascus sp. VKM F-4518 (FW-2643)]|nr:hypothetical protein V500_01495 [Pseudogymnoascus sp. VKM F-4518 (FW-2643)]